MNLPVAVRRPLVVAIHAALSALAFYAAFLLRLDDPALRAGPFDYAPHFWKALPILIVLRLLALQAFGLNHGLWRYASLHDLVRLGYAVGVSSAAFFGVSTLLLRWKYVPHGVVAIDAALALLLLGGVRFVRRIAGERRRVADGGSRTVVVGAGDAGDMLVREMRRLGREMPVAFVDDDTTKTGRSIHGVPVRGTVAALGDVIRESGAAEVVVAVAARPADLLRRIAEATEGTGVLVRILPLGRGGARIAALRRLDVADLLTRPVTGLDEDRIRADVAGRSVLVTGGAGSIGSELVRRILGYAPRALTVVDRDENALHYLLDGLAAEGLAAPTTVHVADVSDPAVIGRILETTRPDYVIHAAAYKHVPLMEGNVLSALANNVLATRAILRAADRAGVGKFLLVSSDKAVRPTSVMGATKRAAEVALSAAPMGGATRVAVRFGNVVGSAGSVVPLFLRQIERGGPVTVTDENATRFFMTIPEAVSLVLQAAAMAKGGEVYHLDMGEPVRIGDLARRMISLAGFVPNRDVEIRQIGLRPGEKLHEELLADHETVAKTAHPQVRVATAPPPDAEAARASLDALEVAVAAGDLRAGLSALVRLVPEYAPTNDEVRRLIGA